MGRSFATQDGFAGLNIEAVVIVDLFLFLCISQFVVSKWIEVRPVKLADCSSIAEVFAPLCIAGGLAAVVFLCSTTNYVRLVKLYTSSRLYICPLMVRIS